MTNEEIKQLPSIVNACLDDAILDEVRQDLNEKLDKVCKLAINALEQTEKIAKLVDKMDLEDISSKDFDNMFYLQSVKEIKEEMWMLYHFVKDVSDALDL